MALYNQTFDSLNTADLNGQDSWSGDASFDVQTSVVQAGAKAVGRTGDASAVSVARAITAVLAGVQNFYIRVSDVTDAGGTGVWFSTASGATIAFRIRIGVTSGAITFYNGSDNTIASGLSNDTFYKVSVQFDTSLNGGTGQARVSVNDGAWSSYFNGENNFPGGIDSIALRGAAGNGKTEYWDTFSDGSTAIKTVNGLARASVKTVDGLAVASVKTIIGLA